MRNVPTPRLQWVLFDTGAYYALVDADDANHLSSQAVLQQIGRNRFRPFTTNFILAETHALLLTRLNRGSAERFLRSMERGATTIVRVSARDEERARNIIYQYDDKNFSFTDAASFAVMERLRIGTAFTFDGNFNQYRLAVLPEPQPR